MFVGKPFPFSRPVFIDGPGKGDLLLQVIFTAARYPLGNESPSRSTSTGFKLATLLVASLKVAWAINNNGLPIVLVVFPSAPPVPVKLACSSGESCPTVLLAAIF